MTTYDNETLVDLIRNGAAKDRKDYLTMLYNQNYPYIRKICKRFSGIEEIDDLMQEAYFGLRIAVSKYDDAQGVPFINYAAIWIEQVVKRYIADCGNVVRLPVYLREGINKYKYTVKAFTQENGREPTDQELRSLLSLTERQFERLKDRVILDSTLSLDTKVTAEDGAGAMTFVETIADPEDHYEEIDNRIDREIFNNDVWNEVDRLRDREAEIIKEYFIEEKTLDDIGISKGITRERVRQIRNRGLDKLKQSKLLNTYREELCQKGYNAVGLRAYRNTGTSSTERTAIKLYNYGITKNVNDVEKTIKRAKKKYGITLDEFRQSLTDKITETMNK